MILENYIQGNTASNSHYSYRFPWVTRKTTRNNKEFVEHYFNFAGMNPLCILNPINITEGVSMDAGHIFCLMPTTGYYTHCSYGYSTDSTKKSNCSTVPNWNATLWSGYNFTICDIFHFFHRSLSLWPHYNWERTGSPVPPDSPALPSPNFPPHLLLLAASIHWETFDEGRNLAL